MTARVVSSRRTSPRALPRNSSDHAYRGEVLVEPRFVSQDGIIADADRCQQPTTCNAPPAWSCDHVSFRPTCCGVALSMTVCKTVRDIRLIYTRSRIRALTYINGRSRPKGRFPAELRLSAAPPSASRRALVAIDPGGDASSPKSAGPIHAGCDSVEASFLSRQNARVLKPFQIIPEAILGRWLG